MSNLETKVTFNIDQLPLIEKMMNDEFEKAKKFNNLRSASVELRNILERGIGAQIANEICEFLVKENIIKKDKYPMGFSYAPFFNPLTKELAKRIFSHLQDIIRVYPSATDFEVTQSPEVLDGWAKDHWEKASWYQMIGNALEAGASPSVIASEDDKLCYRLNDLAFQNTK